MVPLPSLCWSPPERVPLKAAFFCPTHAPSALSSKCHLLNAHPRTQRSPAGPAPTCEAQILTILIFRLLHSASHNKPLEHQIGPSVTCCCSCSLTINALVSSLQDEDKYDEGGAFVEDIISRPHVSSALTSPETIHCY